MISLRTLSCQINSFFKGLRSSSRTRQVIYWISTFFFFMYVLIFLGFDGLYPFNLIGRLLFFVFLALGLIYAILWNPNSFKLRLFVCLYGLLCIIYVVSYVVNLPINSSSPFTQLSVALISVFTFFWIIIEPPNPRYKLLPFFIIAVASWVFCLYLVVTNVRVLLSFDFGSRSLAVELGNQNDVARKIALSAAYNFGFAIFCSKLIFKTISNLFAIAFSLLIPFTGSVSNLLLIIVVVLSTIFFYFPKKYRWLYFFFLLITLISGIVLLSLDSFAYYRERLLGIFLSLIGQGDSSLSDASATGRLDALVASLRLFLDSPLIGNGTFSVQLNFFRMAHNNIGETLADYGIFGGIFGEMLILFPLFRIRHTKNANRPLIVLLVIYIFINQFFLVTFNAKADMMFIGLVWALETADDSLLTGNYTGVLTPILKTRKVV